MMDFKETIMEAFSGMTESEDDVISKIKNDHRKLEELFKSFEEARTKAQKMKIVREISAELTVHANAEEKLVYPLVEKKDDDMTREAEEEHHLLKILIKELASFDGSEENFKAKVTVLKEVNEHHVKEEELDLLPKLKDTGADLKELGEEFEADKAKQMKKLKPVKAKAPRARAKSAPRSSARKAS